LWRVAFQPIYVALGASPMPDVIARPHASRPLIAVSAIVGVAIVGAVLLWAHYGTTVFFATIRAGFSACFG